MFPSSSQVTLVNPDPPTALVFTKSSTLNTTLLNNNKPYFKVSTLDAAGARTTRTNVETNELLVTIKKRTLHSDTIKFANKHEWKSLKQKDWLVDGKLADGFPKRTIRTPVGSFVWRRDVVYRLALCPENDLDHPVTYTQFPTMEDRSTPWALLLTRGTESFRDEIVASFLILEQHLRMEEKATGVAGAQFASASVSAQMSFAGGY
ncbi:hypothetical protein GALMADRAFT_222045 [Galerina marginata CBS 339.88]|uniref:DUF6593 domain-containing protein n=1 Tax=Galerina marginata (strain CBS 339.88) TaxID=685588 RepID=A0A067TG85_GALM3|nr:hypothetical protein GALMADRAFT_222045 [Galerina marginata CBS 339.88]